MKDRESLVFKAKLAEQAERFDEMVTYMKEVAREAQELTVEERNLLYIAYKNEIGSRRASWRAVSSIVEQKGDSKKNAIIKVCVKRWVDASLWYEIENAHHWKAASNPAVTQDYKAKIEAELINICNDFISLIDEVLVLNSRSEEAKDFYWHLKINCQQYGFKYLCPRYLKTSQALFQQ